MSHSIAPTFFPHWSVKIGLQLLHVPVKESVSVTGLLQNLRGLAQTHQSKYPMAPGTRISPLPGGSGLVWDLPKSALHRLSVMARESLTVSVIFVFDCS